MRVTASSTFDVLKKLLSLAEHEHRGIVLSLGLGGVDDYLCPDLTLYAVRRAKDTGRLGELDLAIDNYLSRISRHTYDGPRESIAGATAMDDLNQRLRVAVEAAFGTATSANRLASFAGCNVRRAQYWLKGDSEPPVEIVEALEAAIHLYRQINPETVVGNLVSEWRAAGLHDDLISLALARAHQTVIGRAIS